MHQLEKLTQQLVYKVELGKAELWAEGKDDGDPGAEV